MSSLRNHIRFIRSGRSVTAVGRRSLLFVMALAMLMSLAQGPALAASQEISDREFYATVSRYSQPQAVRELRRYEQLAGKTTACPRWLWRAAYLHLRLGWLSKSAEGKKAHFFKALEYGQRACRMAPDHYYARLVLGAARAKVTKYVSAGEKVRIARQLKKEAEWLLLRRKDDPNVWYMLGWWNFEIASLPVGKKIVASLLYGGLPKEASMDRAIACMKEAIALRPDYCVYHYDLGRFYQKQGKLALARQQYAKVLQMQPVCCEEFSAQKKARKKLRKLMTRGGVSRSAPKS